MVWWVFGLAFLAILSYLTDVGTIVFLQNLRVPLLNASLLSLLILLCSAGLLARMLWMQRRGEKEILQERIFFLEKELVKHKKGE